MTPEQHEKQVCDALRALQQDHPPDVLEHGCLSMSIALVEERLGKGQSPNWLRELASKLDPPMTKPEGPGEVTKDTIEAVVGKYNDLSSKLVAEVGGEAVLAGSLKFLERVVRGNLAPDVAAKLLRQMAATFDMESRPDPTVN